MAKKKSSFRDKVKSDSSRQQSGKSNYGYLMLPKGVKVFSPTPGERHKFDIMPYAVTDKHHPDRDEEKDIAMVGDLWYKRPFKVHKNIGSGNDSVVCPTSIGLPCPICAYRVKRAKDGADREELKALTPSVRNLYVVIPIGEKKMEEVPHIWDMSQFLFQELLNEELDENDDNAVFPDLEEGLTLKVRFDSKTFGGSKPYAEASRIDFLDRDKGYDESILEDIPNLDEVLKILPFKEIEAKFFEMEDVNHNVDDDDDDDDKKKPKKPSRKEPEKEDDDDETPRRKKAAGKEKPTKDLTWEDLKDMEEDELLEVIESKDLDVDPSVFEDDEMGLRNAIAAELEIEIPRAKPTRTAPMGKTIAKKEEKEDDDDAPAVKVKGKDACVACQGTGLNSRGKKCQICEGTGRKPKDDDDDDDHVVASKSKSEKDKNPCPHGHKFGKDCDKHKECNTCDKWDDCVDAQ